MMGFVYILSNDSMPGLYKIGCTSRKPEVRADELSNATGVPTPFIVEYCIYIENYTYIERLIHSNLLEYNHNKEFFKCDLIKCILELKRTAIEQYSYKEKYSSKHLRSKVEGWENKYLQELRDRKIAEEREKNRLEEQNKEVELKDRQGCGTVFIWLAIANIAAAFILPHPSDMLFYGFIISLGIGLYLKR